MRDSQVVGYCENGDVSWFHVAIQKDGHEDLSLIHGVPPIRTVSVLGFPSDSGIFLEEEVHWERAHPKEPFLESEWNALLNELRIRFQESSRHLSWDSDTLRLIGFTLRNVRFDGKRIINPVGFSGRTLSLFGRATFLFSEIFGPLRGECSVLMPILLDDAALQLLGIELEGVFFVLEEQSSSVSVFRAGKLVRRTTIAMGHRAIRRKFMRLCDLTSSQAADELLLTFVLGGLHSRMERQLRHHLFTSLSAWGEGLFSAVKLPLANIPYTIVSAHPVPLFNIFLKNRSRMKKDLFPHIGQHMITVHEASQWFSEKMHEPRDVAVRIIAKARSQHPELLFIPAVDRTLI